MRFRPGRFLLWAIALLPPAFCHADDAKQFVQRAVQTELAADQDDHSRWIYFETDRKPDRSVKQWVAETRDGTLRRVVEFNGQPVPESEQRRKMDAFLRDSWARSRQHKSEQHDDEQATELLQSAAPGVPVDRRRNQGRSNHSALQARPAISPARP